LKRQVQNAHELVTLEDNSPCRHWFLWQVSNPVLVGGGLWVNVYSLNNWWEESQSQNKPPANYILLRIGHWTQLHEFPPILAQCRLGNHCMMMLVKPSDPNEDPTWLMTQLFWCRDHAWKAKQVWVPILLEEESASMDVVKLTKLSF
jgi:hypothetical protein